MSYKLNDCTVCYGTFQTDNKISNHNEAVCFGCFEKLIFRTLNNFCPYIKDNNIVNNTKCYACCLSKYHLLTIKLCDTHYNFIKDRFKIQSMDLDMDEDM